MKELVPCWQTQHSLAAFLLAGSVQLKKPSPAQETPHFQSKSSALCLVVSMFIATVACLNWHDQYREICWFTMGKTIAHTPK